MPHTEADYFKARIWSYFSQKLSNGPGSGEKALSRNLGTQAL